MTPISQAVVTALINQADPTKRWFPYPKMKNVEDVRAEPEYFTFNDNSKVRVQQGIRTANAMITEIGQLGATSPKMKKKIESGACTEMGFYYVGLDGSLTGKVSDDASCAGCGCGLSLDNTGFSCEPLMNVTLRLIAVPIYDSTGALNFVTRADGTNVYPVRINQQTLFANLIKPKDKEPNMLALSFEVDTTEKDGNLVTIPCDELGGSYLVNIAGLKDVCATVVSPNDSGATLILKTDFGVPVEGLVVADFVSSDTGVTGQIYNQTQDADVALTGATEGDPGEYALTWAAQSPADVLIPDATKTNLDFTCMKDDSPIVVPTS